MQKVFLQLVASFLLFTASFNVNAAEKFPNVSGSVLFQAQSDRALSSQKTGVSPNNAFIYIEPKTSLNFNRNWSVKTHWRLQPNNSLTTRDSTYPERYRTHLQQDRSIGADDTGLLLEELKVNFENEDMRFSAGKFDPTFGVAHNKAKRIGVFTSQFTEDYNLREKLGGSLTAILENAQFTLNSFLNDTTGLSQSALNHRGRAERNDGSAGNTGTLSSYSFSMEGSNFFGIEDWVYNLGFRSLSVDAISGSEREKGYVFSSEYSYQIGRRSYLIPFMEVVKIDNFTGEEGRNAIYTTTALIANYSSWTTSVSSLRRDIRQSQRTSNIKDYQLQLSVGYKFTNNITLDVSRSTIKEDGYKASLVGVLLSYLYKF